MHRRLTRVVIVAVVLIAAGGAFLAFGRGVWYPLLLQIRGPRTVADVVAKYGPSARARLKPHFQRAGVAYPPKEIAILGFKDEKRVAFWARGDSRWRFIRDYPVLAASGHAGPKLREGDRQVPEGEYGVEALNPNSRFHVALRLDYPNAEDRAHAAREGRAGLGGDIKIGRAHV